MSYTFTNQEVKVTVINTYASQDHTVEECPADEIWKVLNFNVAFQTTGTREVSQLHLKDPKTSGNSCIKNQTAASTLFWNDNNEPRWLYPGWKIVLTSGAGGAADGTATCRTLIARFKRVDQPEVRTWMEA